MWFSSPCPATSPPASIFAGVHAVAALVAPDRAVACDRPAGRAHARRGRPVLVPVRWRSARQPRHLARPAVRSLGIARVGGVILLTWVVFQLGFALAGPAPTVPRLVRRRRPSATGAPHGVIALAAIVVVHRPRRRRPAGVADRTHDHDRRRAGRRRAGHPSRRRAVARRHSNATSRRRGRSSPTRTSTSSLWPENVVDVNDDRSTAARQHAAIAAEAARLGVPFAVGVTEDADQTGRGEPGRITNAQVVVTPDGRVTSRYDKVRRVPFGEYVPLRGLLEALGAPVDQVRTRRRGRHRAGRDRAARRHRARRRDLVGGVLRRPGPRGREARRVDHRQPDQRLQLHGHRAADPAGRVEPPACRRDRALGRAGRADRVLGVRRRRTARSSSAPASASAPSSSARSSCARRTWYVEARRRAVDRRRRWSCSSSRCGSAAAAPLRARRPADHRRPTARRVRSRSAP